MKISLLLTLVLLYGSCSSLVNPQNSQETLAVGLITARCAELGNPDIDVRFSNGPPLTLDGQPAFMWTSVTHNMVTVYRDEVHDLKYTPEIINSYAKHECCHLFLGHNCSTQTAETAADTCAKERF